MTFNECRECLPTRSLRRNITNHEITISQNSSTNDDEDDASDDEPTLEPTHDSGNLERPETGVYTTNGELVLIPIIPAVYYVTEYEVT